MRSMTYDFPTYVVSGAAALILSWALSGCRFGNNVVPQGQLDTISGYYETQAQSLTFCAATTGTETCKAVNASQTPELIAGTIADPVGFYLADPASGSAILFNPDNLNHQFGILLAEDMSLYDLVWSQAFPLWDSPAHRLCNTKQSLESVGALVQGNGPFNSGSKRPLSGRIQLTYTFSQIFLQSCTDTLSAIANCYQDSSRCEGTNASQNLAQQAEWQAMFAPYFSAGAMSINDLPNLTSIRYKVSYQ